MDDYRGFIVYKYTGKDASLWYGGDEVLYHGALYLHYEVNSSEPIDLYTGLHKTEASLHKEIDSLYDRFPKLADAVMVAEAILQAREKNPLLDGYAAKMLPEHLRRAVHDAAFRNEAFDRPFIDYPMTA